MSNRHKIIIEVCKYKESLPLTDMWYINGRVESLPLTDMRYINGWVESLVLRRKAGDFFYMEKIT